MLSEYAVDKEPEIVINGGLRAKKQDIVLTLFPEFKNIRSFVLELAGVIFNI